MKSAASPAAEGAAPLVRVERLTRHFEAHQPWLLRVLARRPRRYVRAVDDVSFTIARGRTLGLVGESGCGKSTLARCLAGLIQPGGGAFFYDGGRVNLRRPGFGHLQMIFQDPYSSLNPRWRVERIIGDPLLAFGLVSSRAQMRSAVAGLLEQVGLAPEDATLYPHEFSGGQRQRIAIARTLAARPDFLICDEPTSALDVSVQAQILNLMRSLQRSRNLTYLFISHNLAVVDHMADEIGVMYFGSLVELRAKSAFFARPLHPYSRLLIGAAPDMRTIGLPAPPPPGEVPSPFDPPGGCAFHPRCPLATELCRRERPRLRPLAEGGSIACHAVRDE